MTYADENKNALSQMYDDVDYVTDQLIQAQDMLRNISDRAQRLSKNDRSMRISALIESNHHDLKTIRTRNIEIKEAITEWWNNL